MVRRRLGCGLVKRRFGRLGVERSVRWWILERCKSLTAVSAQQMPAVNLEGTDLVNGVLFPQLLVVLELLAFLESENRAASCQCPERQMPILCAFRSTP